MIYSLSFSVSLLPLVEGALVAARLVEEEALAAAEQGRGSPAASLVMICMAARSVKEDTLLIIIIITVQLGKWLLSKTSFLVALKISTKEPPRR